jgi:hypothetical protein
MFRHFHEMTMYHCHPQYVPFSMLQLCTRFVTLEQKSLILLNYDPNSMEMAKLTSKNSESYGWPLPVVFPFTSEDFPR